MGIDYALFIVTRHRQHLHAGMSVPDAAGTAVATAGQAVLFAGTTVVIAILGLFLAGLPAISGMGAAVALVVTVSMIAAITLLPGLLGLAGGRRSTSCRSTARPTWTSPRKKPSPVGGRTTSGTTPSGTRSRASWSCARLRCRL